jgi:hypothetical protein
MEIRGGSSVIGVTNVARRKGDRSTR